MTCHTLIRGGVSALALGLHFAALPVTIELGHADRGLFGLTVSQAFAKDGGDDDGGKSGRDDRDDDDRSGSGGGRNDDGDRGGNSDDDVDRDDNRSGRGGGDDDGFDDRGDDDRRSRGRESDDRPLGSVGSLPGGASGSGGLSVVTVEQTGGSLEIVYSNGIKEEIEGNRYELKNAAGRTLIERSATAGDLARMRSNVRNSRGLATGGVAPVGSVRRVLARSEVRKVEVAGRSIEVSYTTGWREQVERNRYELKDPDNNTVVERRATQADIDRLMALAD